MKSIFPPPPRLPAKSSKNSPKSNSPCSIPECTIPLFSPHLRPPRVSCWLPDGCGFHFDPQFTTFCDAAAQQSRGVLFFRYRCAGPGFIARCDQRRLKEGRGGGGAASGRRKEELRGFRARPVKYASHYRS